MISVFRFAFFSTLLVCGRVAFDPNLGKVAEYQFPEQVVLEQSELIESRSIETKGTSKYWPDLKGHEYRYQREGKSFQVQIHYLREANGEVASYFSGYGVDRQKAVIEPEQRSGKNGVFLTFQHQQTAYLSSCINSSGPSTVTQAQFLANRNAHDLKFERIVPVVLGTEDLRDSRCLWVTISTPIANQSLTEVQQQLESVWQDIDTGWSTRFPKRI